MTFTPGKAPVGGWAGTCPTYRLIGGIAWQQVKPYVLAAIPRPDLPDLYVWLRKVALTPERDVWSATIVQGHTRITEVRGRSAVAAVDAVMADPYWDEAVPPPEYDELTPAQAYAVDYAARYPAGHTHTPAGWYPERPSAHDRRWDTRQGVA